MRRHAPATERNREPIIEVLAEVLPETGLVLEIASGTGEHAAAFATRFPRLDWQPSDPDADSRDSIAGNAALNARSCALPPRAETFVTGRRCTACERERMVGNNRSGDLVSSTKTVLRDGSSRVLSNAFAPLVLIASADSMMKTLCRPSYGRNEACSMMERICSTAMSLRSSGTAVTSTSG